MRRVVPVVVLAMTGLVLVASPAAGLRNTPKNTPPHGTAWTTSAQTAAHAAGPCIVTGQALDYSGGGMAGAEVDLWCDNGAGSYVFVGRTYTDASGSFGFTSVPETADAYIAVFVDGGGAYQTWGNVVTAAGPNVFTLQPGASAVTIIRSPDPRWSTWTRARIETWGSAGGGTTWIEGDAGAALAMPPDVTYAIAYPFGNQGIEWRPASPLPIISGATTGEAMAFDQADGRSARLARPRWRSGKPGATIRIALENWPLGYRASFYGYSQIASDMVKRWSSSVRSDGTNTAATLTIPATARPGYTYEVHTYRSDDRRSYLDLTTGFQVCTLKSSRAVVNKGRRIKLSGVVPTQDHWGTNEGQTKRVTIYRRTRPAPGAPTVWDATRQGWTRVAHVTANGFGRYSAYLRPRRTTWYVVRYPGDDWYWGAYTSVLKVRVR